MQASAPSRFRSPWLHLLWAVPLAVAAWPTALFLWDKWTRNIWLSGHGVLVPPLSLYLGWFALRHRRRPGAEEPSAWGYAFLVSGMAMVAADAGLGTGLLAAFGLLWSVPGLALLLLGPKSARALLLPWILSLSMLPVPSAFVVPIHTVLRRISAVGTARLLDLVGIPNFQEGTLIHLPRATLRVVEECSGFTALYSALTIGLVLAYMTRSWRRRLLLVLLPFPLTIAANTVRVFALAYMSNELGTDVLETAIHPFTGWATFVVSTFGMFLVADRTQPATRARRP